MVQSIFEEMGGRYERKANTFYPPYHTTRKGTVDRLIRTAALGLSAGVPQNYIHQSSHKRQAQCLPSDIDRQAQEHLNGS